MSVRGYKHNCPNYAPVGNYNATVMTMPDSNLGRVWVHLVHLLHVAGGFRVSVGLPTRFALYNDPVLLCSCFLGGVLVLFVLV